MKLAKKLSAYNIIPASLHVARCFGAIEVGSSASTFNGKTTISPKMIAQFEVLDWYDQYGNAPAINQIYTVSAHPKAKLRQDFELLNGTRFSDAELLELDTSWMVGRYCMLNIVHAEANGFINAKISGLAAIPTGIELPNPVHADRVFSIYEPDLSVFNGLPDWVKAMIKGSEEWKDFPRTDGWEVHHLNPPEAANEPAF